MVPALVKSGPGEVFYWNISAAVGLHAPNLTDDVMFIQWCFYKMSKWDRIKPAYQAIYADVGVNGSCTGQPDDPLVIAIKALQEDMGIGLADSRVSPAPKGYYWAKGHKYEYIIFVFNAALRLIHPQFYPRIDLMPEFIWRVKDEALYPFI